MRIRLSWPHGSARIELDAGDTAAAIAAALPVEAKAHRWGDEVYFRLPVTAQLDPDASDVVPPGTVCYWVEGESVAIPFGPTPVSVADECRLVTRVNRVGALVENAACLATVDEGDPVTLELEPG
jgi:hypothetical protein